MARSRRHRWILRLRSDSASVLPYTSAFSASLLLALVPLWVATFTSVLNRQPPPPATLLALGLAAGGTALFVGTRTSVSLGWGDVVSLIVAALYATYLLLNRRLVDRYAPFTLTTYAASLAAIPILVLTAPSPPQQDWAAVTHGGWLAWHGSSLVRSSWPGPSGTGFSVTSHQSRSLHSCSPFP